MIKMFKTQLIYIVKKIFQITSNKLLYKLPINISEIVGIRRYLYFKQKIIVANALAKDKQNRKSLSKAILQLMQKDGHYLDFSAIYLSVKPKVLYLQIFKLIK